MNWRALIVKAAAVFGLAFAAPAAAEPIMLDSASVGDSFTVGFDGFVDGGSSLEGLSSEITLTLDSIVNGVYNFSYSVTNTGSTTDGVSSRVSSFAFNTNPDITGASSTGTYAFTNTDSNYPNGIGRVDVCFQGTNTGSCAGGGSAGLFDGETGTGTLSLDFGTAPASLTLDDFYVRYQSVSGLGDVTSASGRQTSTSGGTDVPAPGMMLLFALATLALFAGTRRRRFAMPQTAPALAYA
ncbi:cistern family PEP-CTERM protein [Qipengyuania zhejiangensis]|uniref:cistern family PEP-CTERM protein n=1 Tax=Qipengyuania zhejiangensis TaxID=3077782 RepID=UPI002D771485|nr:cistern family PEP-CTERM protein [Qipengyuania sp. Z2]